jgi:hypothetical protein
MREPGKRQRVIIQYSSDCVILFNMNRRLFSLYCGLLFSFTGPAQVAMPGQSLPFWQPGYLDIHHINTGRGNAAFCILPDGTNLLVDAGELDPTEPRTTSARNTPMHPDDSKHAFEWIADYI